MTEVNSVNVEFRTVDLDRHADLCVQFAADMDVCSFGYAAQPCDADGEAGKRCIERMRDKLAADPGSCLHVWCRGEIVGQLNLGVLSSPPSATSMCSTLSLNGVAGPSQTRWNRLPPNGS